MRLRASQGSSRRERPPRQTERPASSAQRPAATERRARRSQGSASLRYLYVVELDCEVLKERRFVRANPDRDPQRPCVYVGVTGLQPRQRFANHMRGYKANRYVYRYGVRLLPELYEHLNPLPYAEAVEMERVLADRLRSRGYGVWQN